LQYLSTKNVEYFSTFCLKITSTSTQVTFLIDPCETWSWKLSWKTSVWLWPVL